MQYVAYRLITQSGGYQHARPGDATNPPVEIQTLCAEPTVIPIRHGGQWVGVAEGGQNQPLLNQKGLAIF
jgi:hypothetical protein